MQTVDIDPTLLDNEQLDDPPLSSGDLDHDQFKVGTLAPDIPNDYVQGHVYGRIAQNPASAYPDDPRKARASTTIDANKKFVIDLYWDLSGRLVPAFGGQWAVTIFFDCEMHPEEFNLRLRSDLDIDPDCDGCEEGPPDERLHHARYEVDPEKVKVEVTDDKKRGTPYELSISIVLLDYCGCYPNTGVVGFVDLGSVLFYSRR